MSELRPSQRRYAADHYGPTRNGAPGGGDDGPHYAANEPEESESWIYWTLAAVIVVSIAAIIAALAGCGGGAKALNPLTWFGKPNAPGIHGPPDPTTAGEWATYAALIDMARVAFFSGVASLIAGVIAGHWFPPLKVLTGIGTTLIGVGIGTAAACLLLDRYGGWAAAALLITLVGALGMWLWNRWQDSKWEARKRKRVVALRVAGNTELADALEAELA